MKVLITGANGFVGGGLCRAALEAGHEALALVRAGSNTELIPMRARQVHGDFTSAAAMHALLTAERPDAIIHAAAIVSSGTPNFEQSLAINVDGTATLLRAAEATGVARWIQISSMSAHAENCSVYGATKLLADGVVRGGAVSWTIVRPSLVYGPQQRGIFHRFVQQIRRLPVVPLPGGGHEPMRPVHIEDLSRAVVRALEVPAAIGSTYQLGGPEADWRLRDVVQAIARGLGLRRTIVPLPLPLCRIGALVGEALLSHPPMTTDNLEGMVKAQPLDTRGAERDLSFAPRRFDDGFRGYLAAAKR